MKPFRFVVNGQKTHIQEYKKEMLFGPEWETIISFVGCRNRCKQIVDLLNECAKISKNKQKND